MLWVIIKLNKYAWWPYLEKLCVQEELTGGCGGDPRGEGHADPHILEQAGRQQLNQMEKMLPNIQ